MHIHIHEVQISKTSKHKISCSKATWLQGHGDCYHLNMDKLKATSLEIQVWFSGEGRKERGRGRVFESPN